MQSLADYLMENDALTRFYAASLRGSLFTGFLTMSGFLFTVKSFLIVRLQTDVYGKTDYQEWIYSVGRRYNKTITPYGSLRRLGWWMFLAICTAFVASVSQLTIGLLEVRWATWMCLTAAAVAAIIFFITLLIIRHAIRGWITYLEEEAQKKFAQPPTAADSSKSQAVSA